MEVSASVQRFTDQLCLIGTACNAGLNGRGRGLWLGCRRQASKMGRVTACFVPNTYKTTELHDSRKSVVLHGQETCTFLAALYVGSLPKTIKLELVSSLRSRASKKLISLPLLLLRNTKLQTFLKPTRIAAKIPQIVNFKKVLSAYFVILRLRQQHVTDSRCVWRNFQKQIWQLSKKLWYRAKLFEVWG